VLLTHQEVKGLLEFREAEDYFHAKVLFLSLSLYPIKSKNAYSGDRCFQKIYALNIMEPWIKVKCQQVLAVFIYFCLYY